MVVVDDCASLILKPPSQWPLHKCGTCTNPNGPCTNVALVLQCFGKAPGAPLRPSWATFSSVTLSLFTSVDSPNRQNSHMALPAWHSQDP